MILGRLLDSAGKDKRLDEVALGNAHAVLVKWADLETKGRLGKLRETQLQGDFLAQVFGEALGYTQVVEGAAEWHQEQHRSFANQTPDAVLGKFRPDAAPELRAVIELKGPLVHLDRDRSQGRTAIDQCWDYLVNMPPECRWGIVSNIVSFRLYERGSTKRAYEHFTLQELRNLDAFRRFYALLRRQSLTQPAVGETFSRSVQLLIETANKRRSVGDELYENYSRQRYNLIEHLHLERKFVLDDAVEMAQRLFDRMIFIAFCEDRELLPTGTINEACKAQGFLAAKNPRWQNFKNLFGFIDRGSEDYDIPQYNGGLFAPHAVDELELPDRPWTTFFKQVGEYDFAMK